MRRASETGASSWPTWTPSAPTSSARSGRSFSTKGTPWSRHTAAATRGPGQQRLGVELLVAQLDHVHAAGDAVVEEVGQVRPVRRAEVEAALREVGTPGHPPPAAAAFALALAFIAFLVARTLARLSGLVMSATERELPSLP